MSDAAHALPLTFRKSLHLGIEIGEERRRFGMPGSMVERSKVESIQLKLIQERQHGRSATHSGRKRVGKILSALSILPN